VPRPEHPPSSDYVPGPELPPLPVYVHEPEYPKYLVPSEDEAPMEDQPLLDDALPTTLSLGYVVDFNPEEDPEEDHVDYPADGWDGDDESPQIIVPLSQTRLHKARKTVRPQKPIPFPSKAEVARLLALPTPPPSLLSP
nr:hypothetical protein [Tanacetum cinerariifolium]